MKIKLTNVFLISGKRYLMIIMRTFIFLCFTTVFSFTPNNLISQNSKIKIEQDKKLTVDQVFDLIMEQTDYKFIYQEGLFEKYDGVEVKKGVIRTNKLLDLVLSNKNFNVLVTKSNIIIIKEKTRHDEKLQKTVTGTVTNESGEPLVGASVLVKGTYQGTLTNFDGSYSMTVRNPENVLVFSFLGYKDLEVTVGNLRIIDVSLEESVSELDEVVVNAGYYNTTRAISTGNISKISSKDIEKQPVTNPIATLQGRAAGVFVNQETGTPGGGFSIQIRGLNSIGASNQPLYIVDGTPINNENLTDIISSQGLFSDGINPLNGINPNNIESIEVLKDGDATAIYGSRGANGVVLITTKKGKAGKTEFDVNMYSGFSTVTNKLDYLNTQEYLELRREAFANDGVSPTAGDYDLNGTYDENKFTDFQDFFIGNTAHNNSLQLAVSGGSEYTQFRVSGGFSKETTVTIGDFDFKKISLQTNINHRSKSNKFKLVASFSYSSNIGNFQADDFVSAAGLLAPNRNDLLNDDGSLNFDINNTISENPLGRLERKYIAKTNYFYNNINLSYELLPSLTVKVNAGFNINTVDERQTNPTTRYLNPETINFGSNLSSARSNNTANKSWNAEPQINWVKETSFGKFNVLAGATWQSRTTNIIRVNVDDFPDDALINNLAAATNSDITDNIIDFRYNAFFGRINYNLKDKYILNLTGRRDGSSRFGPGKRFSNFGAIGASWVFSKEKFLEDNPILSFGKLRASYGTTGNDQIGEYQFLDTYRNTSNYGASIGIVPSRLFNPNYAWEGVNKLEFALNLGFLKDRINLDIAYYRNRTDNQLIGIPLSSLTGFSSIQDNLPAVVENRGLELELFTKNFQSANFSWNTNFNISIPQNELIKFPGLEENPNFRNTLVIGQPIDVTRVYESTGVDLQTGLYTFTDFDDSGDITALEDRQVYKTSRPEFYGGLTNNLSYKGFELDFTFQFVKKEGLNNNGVSVLGVQNIQRNILNRWQQPGDIASVQRVSTINNNTDALEALRFYGISDAAYTDASYIRLNNVSLSYNVPEKITKGFRTRVYFQAQNLLTITNYKGLDPETTSSFTLPPLKTITLGAQFTF